MDSAPSIRRSLLNAAASLAESGRAATVRELADAAGVPQASARWAVPDLRKAGGLRIVRMRRVPWSRRSVAEYEPTTSPCPSLNLSAVMHAWARPA